MNPADGRPLSRMDRIYFDKGCYQLSGLAAFESRHLSSDRKLRQAYKRAILASPMLRTRVEGQAEDLVFRAISDRRDWPQLVILKSKQGTDKHAESVAREFKEKNLLELQKNKDLQRNALRTCCCRGKKFIYVSIVTPHHFLDGPGLGTILFKWTSYARLPRLAWPLLDLVAKDRSIPTFFEMALKNDFKDRFYETDGSLIQHLTAPDVCFDFNHYDALKPTAVEHIHGLPRVTVGWHESPHSMNNVRKALRVQGLTISTAFTALSIKIMALLIDAYLEEESESRKPLVSTIGCDLRQVGKWNDKRDQRFPICGNYAYALNTLTEFELARFGSLEDLARHIKHDTERVRSDAEYLLHILQHGTKAQPKYYCGVSSVLIPKQATRMGVAPCFVDTFIEFGPMPRVWFYVITTGNQTQVAVDIGLPFAGLKQEHHAWQAIQVASQDSVLAPLFNRLPK